MERNNSWLRHCVSLIFSLCLVLSFLANFESVQAFTASVGQPYSGRLINGVPFPRQFPGYQLREEERTCTTPEVIGAILDAVEQVGREYPSTCDLYFGDFSRPSGGWMGGHRSHQNGRDADLGMYAKDNRPLDSLIPMNEENLDAPKTWCLIEGLLRSQRVQYIFLDRRVQQLLYDYALSRGVDQAYLDRLFGNERGAIIRHLGNHQDHLHVRFFAPWSTMAAQLNDEDDQKRKVVELAQQAYLPKKVHYYVKGNERGIEALAQSFGVSRRELCKWNQIHGNDILAPGACLVFYKRGFEIEPVHLAQSLRADSVPETAGVRVASLRPARSFSDIPLSLQRGISRERKSDGPVITSYSVRRGDTIAKIARANKMDVKALCDLNGFRAKTVLKSGQKVKLVSARAGGGSDGNDAAGSTGLAKMPGKTSSGVMAIALEKSKPAPATHTVSKGESLASIARQKGVDVKTLCSLNGLKKTSNLSPGQNILLAKVETSIRDADGPSANLRPTSGAMTSGRLPSKQETEKDRATSAKQRSSAASSSKTSPQVTRSKAGSAPLAKTTKTSNQTSKSTKEKMAVSAASKSKSSSPSVGDAAKGASAKQANSKSAPTPTPVAAASKVAPKKKVN